MIALASIYRCSENVGIHAVVVPELELGNVRRHVFGAHLVEGTDDAALEDPPEAFDCVSVNHANHILLAVVIDRLVSVLNHSRPFLKRSFRSYNLPCIQYQRYFRNKNILVQALRSNEARGHVRITSMRGALPN